MRRGLKLACLQHRADDRGRGNGRSGRRQRTRGRPTAVGCPILTIPMRATVEVGPATLPDSATATTVDPPAVESSTSRRRRASRTGAIAAAALLSVGFLAGGIVRATSHRDVVPSIVVANAAQPGTQAGQTHAAAQPPPQLAMPDAGPAQAVVPSTIEPSTRTRAVRSDRPTLAEDGRARRTSNDAGQRSQGPSPAGLPQHRAYE